MHIECAFAIALLTTPLHSFVQYAEFGEKGARGGGQVGKGAGAGEEGFGGFVGEVSAPVGPQPHLIFYKLEMRVNRSTRIPILPWLAASGGRWPGRASRNSRVPIRSLM